jgi:sec-independent protein translocase protein TatB
MFDVGFSEICLVGLVSLLVIGPEKLPQVARFVGFWLGKIQRMATSVRQEFKEELYAEEFRQLLNQPSEMLNQLDTKGKEIQNLVAEEMQQLQAGFVKTSTTRSDDVLKIIEPEHAPSLAKSTLVKNIPSAPTPPNRPKSKKKTRYGKK